MQLWRSHDNLVLLLLLLLLLLQRVEIIFYLYAFLWGGSIWIVYHNDAYNSYWGDRQGLIFF